MKYEDQKEHDCLVDVHTTSNNTHLSIYSLNEKESLSINEKNCHILENTTTTLGMKENVFKTSLIEEIRDQLPGDSISSCSIDCPLIIEYSHFEKSCDLFSRLPFYN